MDRCSFSINKRQALDIINTIIISNPHDVISYDEDEEPRVYEHNLSVVELFVDGAKKGDRIEDHRNNIIRQSHVLEYTRATNVKISEIVIKNDKICLTAYLKGTSADGDWSNPIFSYDEHLKIWIIRESGWCESETGIGQDGCVTILDFGAYAT